jgi:hypothetical protein
MPRTEVWLAGAMRARRRRRPSEAGERADQQQPEEVIAEGGYFDAAGSCSREAPSSAALAPAANFSA